MLTNDLLGFGMRREKILEKMRDWLDKMRARFDHLRELVSSYVRPFNVIRIQALPRTWTDRNEVLLHAMFQVFIDHVEGEYPFAPWEKRTTLRGRYTDLAEMKRFVEEEYGPAARAAMTAAHERTHAEEAHWAGLELLALYEWYKAGRWDFDFDANGIDGKAKLAHDVECDAKLHRLVELRRELWT